MGVSTDTRVGEIVSKNLSVARLFDDYKIDFCCSGEKSLGEACEAANISVDQILPEIESLLKTEDQDSKYIAGLPLDELISYIVGRHHGYVREKAPFIMKNLKKLIEVHGTGHPELLEISEMFHETNGNLEMHMKKEELILFPYIGKMVRFKRDGTEKTGEFSGIKDLVRVLQLEHQNEGDRFAKISQLTNDYHVPADACNTFGITYRLLQEFEKDLHRHIHLENNLLFQKAVVLEKELIKA